MAFEARRFSPDKAADRWTSLVEQSNEGTLFHRLDFLAYHGDRFSTNEHHLALYKGQSLYGVMPLAIFEENGRRVAKSPYGGSYGGPVFKRVQTYRDSHRIIKAILVYLKDQGVAQLRLTLPISICSCSYSETFRLALLEQGFECANRDISSVVLFDADQPVLAQITSRARNMARKARKSGIEIVEHASLEDFWKVMEKTFAKHQAKPTHTFAQFRWLQDHFPERVYVDVAYLKREPVAGIGYFVLNDRVNSSFYFCQDPDKQQTQALSLLVYQALERSQQQGFRAFDFGTSSVNMEGRPNIFRFKESFNAIGLFRESYVWSKAAAEAEARAK